MAQIRNDMKGSKRLFSTDTEVSHMSHHGEQTYVSVGARHLPPEDEDDDATELIPESLRQPETGSSEAPTPSAERTILSPRRVMRKISANYDTSERDLSQQLDQMSLSSTGLLEQFPAPPVNVLVTAPQSAPPSPEVRFDAYHPSPSHLAPPPNPTIPTAPAAAPVYPSSSIRSGRNEDLTRFVSSSTASGTTLTAGSTASFVKHAGPKQLTHIAPSDVPALPDRVGGMVYDKLMMRWVKALSVNEREDEEDEDEHGAAPANESEDPFRDIESLREEDSRVRDSPEAPPVGDAVLSDDEEEGASVLTADLEQSRIEDLPDSGDEDEEEAELNSFSFDSMDAVAPTESEYANPINFDTTEDMDEDEDDEGEGESTITETSYLTGTNGQSNLPTSRPPVHLSTPIPQSRSDPTGLSSNIRSALKSNSVTPVSALKDPKRSRFQTPLTRLGHRRSVSFSDGKREGPIVGVGRNAPTPDVMEGEGSAVSDGEVMDMERVQPEGQTAISARSKRIAEMLNGIEDSGKCDMSTLMTDTRA